MTSTTFLDGKVTLHAGDCLEVLASLPENSVDSVVCDPPYHLTSIVKRFGGANAAPAKEGKTGAYARASAGFMGKQWDGGDIAFRPETWALVLRVLKPGGHLIAFSGTRTYHRMACAIEDAGFEVRDMIAWHYGCLDTDTQAVTPSGLRSHDALKVGDLVLSYDPTTRSYQWDAVEGVFAYDIDDTVYRISTDHGEQVVSRNHRCLVERGGNETFEFAEDVARQREANVPVLENLPALLDALCVHHEGAGHSQQSVQSGVQESANRESQLGRRASGPTQGEVEGDLRSMWRPVLAQHEVAGAHQNAGLLRAMQRPFSWPRLASARPQRARGMEAGIGSVARRTHDWIVQSFVEGWRYLSKAQGELRLSALCPVPVGVSADGADGWLRDGASAGGRSHFGSLLNQGGSGASHRPSTSEQRGYKPDAVREQQGSQTVRGWSGHKAVVGRVTPERYRGVVWCIRVRTGAFVAVRNGMAFPTGNSGFPKSHNVSKAMDARSKLGSARTEDMRRLSMGEDYVPSGRGRKNYDNGGGSQMNGVTNYTPEGDVAKQWDGWGTALKPATEPMCLARKPLDGTVAENVLKWGVGALNIDACRIGSEARQNAQKGGESLNRIARPNGGDSADAKAVGAYGVGAKQVTTGFADVVGRWPANLMHDNSPEVVAMFPDSDGQQGIVTGNEPTANGFSGAVAFSGMKARVGSAEPRNDSGSAARFFWSSKAAADDRLGSKHPTVKPIDLMQELVRLVTRKGGTVLDPFAGTGTTGEAAWREGMKAILIEREIEYQADIARRMELASQPTKRAAVAKTKNKLDKAEDLPLFSGEPT